VPLRGGSVANPDNARNVLPARERTESRLHHQRSVIFLCCTIRLRHTKLATKKHLAMFNCWGQAHETIQDLGVLLDFSIRDRRASR
jgi:hypothetical protein